MALPLGFEGAKGLADKIQPLVQFPTLMRVVLPGALATVLIYPFTSLRTDLLSAAFTDIWRELLLVVVAIFLIGALISALSGKIYKIFEGRLLWSQFLFDWLQAFQASRVRALTKSAEKAKTEKRTLRYDEIWARLRMYPLDEKGNPYASHPTLLGNILAAYEAYPETRYGMDSVFYWPRLWLELDKDKKTEIDGAWSVADGFLHLSAAGFLGGMLWIITALINLASGFLLHLPLGTGKLSALGGLILILFGYLIYRLSLTFHRRNGETFKATFDLYRDKINAMTRLGPTEITTWKGTWSYLQYLSVYCMECHKYFPANLEQCSSCSYPASDSLEQLKREGVESKDP